MLWWKRVIDSSESYHIKYTFLFKYNFKFFVRYETSDGQTREEMGVIMNPGMPNEELVTVGSYSFNTDDGGMLMVMYTADKNGYRPKVLYMKQNRNKPIMIKNKNLRNSLIGWMLILKISGLEIWLRGIMFNYYLTDLINYLL